MNFRNYLNKNEVYREYYSIHALEILCISSIYTLPYNTSSTQIIKYSLISAENPEFNIVENYNIKTRNITNNMFAIKDLKLFYSAKQEKNKYAVYVKALPIQLL